MKHRKQRHRPKPPHNGNRHQREIKLSEIARQSYSERVSINKLKAERIAEGGYK